MERQINACGIEWDVEYEWDDECLVVAGIYIDGNDLTDLLTDKVTDKIREALHEYFHEDRAEQAEHMAEMRSER